MERTTIQTGTYEENCSIFESGGGFWIVDPGSDAGRIVSILSSRNAVPRAILLTHAHFDHVCAIPELQERYKGLPVYVHKADLPMFGHPWNCRPPDYPQTRMPENVRDAAELPWTIPTPGHTPGGVCYHIPEEKILFSGDTLFAGSIGRTDLPGGSLPALLASLKKLVALDPATVVVPGHGPETTIGIEKTGNPYIV